jgi:hypothetical protein
MVRKNAPPGGAVVYAADASSARFAAGRWRSSLHMPRSASRILLAITDVRIERLQSISDADARAEGFDPRSEAAEPVEWFRRLWAALHPRGNLAWDADPWVWVIVFTRFRVAGGGKHE